MNENGEYDYNKRFSDNCKRNCLYFRFSLFTIVVSDAGIYSEEFRRQMLKHRSYSVA